ncbi:MAG: hypothetical protein ACI3X4_00465, partial [Bacteroidaceae bacterium]
RGGSGKKFFLFRIADLYAYPLDLSGEPNFPCKGCVMPLEVLCGACANEALFIVQRSILHF